MGVKKLSWEKDALESSALPSCRLAPVQGAAERALLAATADGDTKRQPSPPASTPYEGLFFCRMVALFTSGQWPNSSESINSRSRALRPSGCVHPSSEAKYSTRLKGPSTAAEDTSQSSSPAAETRRSEAKRTAEGSATAEAEVMAGEEDRRVLTSRFSPKGGETARRGWLCLRDPCCELRVVWLARDGLVREGRSSSSDATKRGLP